MTNEAKRNEDTVEPLVGQMGTFPWHGDEEIPVVCESRGVCKDGVTLRIRYVNPETHERVENAWIHRDQFSPDTDMSNGKDQV